MAREGEDRLPYEQWIQDALKEVAKRALRAIAEVGGPFADHHFYVTFLTGMKGVQLPDALREQYPTDMTIVLQHRFEDLRVTDKWFSVTLSFGGTPAAIRVPWDAVTRFRDPSVQFSVQFQPIQPPEEPERPALAAAPTPAAQESSPPAEETSGAEVLSLDRFRNK